MTDSFEQGMLALDAAAGRPGHRALIAQLVPIAQGLSRVRPEGVTVADVRAEAVRQGLLPASSKGRALSFLGAVMRAAKLLPTEEFRRSEIDASHGNLQRVWRRP